MGEDKLVAKPGEVDFPQGMAGVVARESTKSFVNGQEGKLYYLGIPIEELAKHSTFEETAYLLLNDRLPTTEELSTCTKKLSRHREIPGAVIDFITQAAPNDHPMAILRTAVSMLSAFDSDSQASDAEGLLNQALKVIVKTATIVAAIARARKGKTIITPQPDRSHTENFMHMMFADELDDYYTEVMEAILITHADHGCNASTFTSIVATSSTSDMLSSVVAGIGSLKGPLHGGANERVMIMLDEIGDPKNAEAYITNAVAEKRKIMGFGHRVYKTMDPRASILHEHAKEVVKRAGTERYLQIAEIVQDTMIEKFGQAGIWPNVDFFSGVVMASMGIETALFTPIFAVSRVVGWTAHVLEQRADNRIFRPRFVYTGPDLESKYVPIQDR